VPYSIGVNAAPLHFPDLASLQLVRSRTPDVDQLDARSLFADMSQPGEVAYDDADREMMGMIHDGDGCGFEDRQVDDSEPEVYAQQPGT
jgi:hypothetical protein